MRIAVTGGGTGGHIYPAVAVCEALKALDPDGELLYIGGTSGMETTIVPAAGIPFKAVTARKMPMSLSMATVRGLAALVKGYLEARPILKAFRADVLVGTGGYVAAAAALAAAHLGIPVVILENNRVAGRTNLILARYAKRICVSFSETTREFPAEKCVLTGLPLRAGTVAADTITSAMARAAFTGLQPDLFTVTVIGGSQGAKAINRIIAEAAPILTPARVQILHQTGKANYDETATMAAKAFEAAGLPANADGLCLKPYLEPLEVPLALRAADLLVCRGGISTLSEAAANGVPMVIIPLPTAYADHQTANARSLQDAGAAMCLPEAGMDGVALAERILALQANPTKLQSMRASSCGAGKPDAAADVARLALKLASPKHVGDRVN